MQSAQAIPITDVMKSLFVRYAERDAKIYTKTEKAR